MIKALKIVGYKNCKGVNSENFKKMIIPFLKLYLYRLFINKAIDAKSKNKEVLLYV